MFLARLNAVIVRQVRAMLGHVFTLSSKQANTTVTKNRSHWKKHRNTIVILALYTQHKCITPLSHRTTVHRWCIAKPVMQHVVPCKAGRGCAEPSWARLYGCPTRLLGIYTREE